MIHSDYALTCKALCDETRVKIFDMLKGGQMCACKILEHFHFTQPTLSYHMKILCDSGLVDCEKQGIWNHYSINTATLNDLTNFLGSKIANDNSGCCK